jgi:hypothetical protein
LVARGEKRGSSRPAGSWQWCWEAEAQAFAAVFEAVVWSTVKGDASTGILPFPQSLQSSVYFSEVQRRHLADGHLLAHQREWFQLGFTVWRHDDSIIGPIAPVTNRLPMIFDKWYAKLSLLHILSQKS